MTISSSLRRAGPYNGNGSATVFPFGFKVFTKNDVLVTLTSSTGIETTLVLDSDYSIALSNDQDSQPGGTVTYPISGAPLPNGLKLTFSGNLQYSQPTDIQNSGGFYPQVVEDALDRLTIQTQQLAEQMSRAVTVDISDPTPPNELFASVLERADASANAAAASADLAATAEEGAETAAQLAMDWATKMDGPVADGERSSKYYAQMAMTGAGLPLYKATNIPTSNVGDIYVEGSGIYSWNGTAYARTSLSLASTNAIFGVGQSWQNFSASRVSGATYTNSTGKPIMVQIAGTMSAADANYNIAVAGRAIGRPAWPSTFVSGGVSCSFIVPPGDTYTVGVTNISSNIWWEYR